MVATCYYMVMDVDGQWQASFRYWGDAQNWLDACESEGFIKEVEYVPGVIESSCAWCTDGTCPACKKW